MEKTIPPFSFTVDRDEEKEEIKLQYHVIWYGETLTLMTRSTGKNLLKIMDPHSLQPPARCRRRREGDQRWWTTGAAAVLGYIPRVRRRLVPLIVMASHRILREFLRCHQNL
jgi:hypothetical protein